MKDTNNGKSAMQNRPHNAKPRVLITGKAYDPHIGGIETVMQQVAEGMKPYANVSVLTCRDSAGLAQKDRVRGIRVYRCGSLGTFASCPLSLDYISAFRRKVMVSDVVELHLPFPLADLACILSGYQGRVVVAWHSDIVRQKKMLVLYRPLMHALLRRADAIIVATQAHIDCSPDLYKYHEKCIVIPYGIDASLYDAALRIPILQDRLHSKTAKKILFVGRLVYYKGVDVLLEAFAALPESVNCELFLAGTGVLEEQLKTRAQELGVADRVHFLGRRMDADLRAAFADCDLFVLPSVANSEAFGIVQLEAMVYGKPVINTALPTGVPLVSVHGETGLTVPPSDAEALSNAMELLLRDDELRMQYGKAARRRVLEQFDLQTILAKTRCVLLRNTRRKNR